MEEVEGIEVVQSPKTEEIQDICQRMCSWERYIIFIFYDFHIVYSYILLIFSCKCLIKILFIN